MTSEPCASEFCDRPAVVYMAGPTLGRSPRLTFIAGDRAGVLGAASDLHGPLHLRCVDCAVGALEDLATVSPPVPSGTGEQPTEGQDHGA